MSMILLESYWQYECKITNFDTLLMTKTRTCTVVELEVSTKHFLELLHSPTYSKWCSHTSSVTRTVQPHLEVCRQSSGKDTHEGMSWGRGRWHGSWYQGTAGKTPAHRFPSAMPRNWKQAGKILRLDLITWQYKSQHKPGVNQGTAVALGKPLLVTVLLP